MARAWLFALIGALAVSTAWAQDPVKVDPKHYKVELENDQVRVLRIHFGPHEKSPMHEHPSSVAVFLTDIHVRHTYPDGKTREVQGKARQFAWGSGATQKHAGENLSDEPFELIEIELKTTSVRTPAAKTK